MTSSAFAALREAVAELYDLRGALALLGWDQQTMMPPRAAEARARQQATLAALFHDKLVDPRFDRLLEPLLDDGTPPVAKSTLDEDARAFVREVVFERERARRLPPALVRELALEESRGFAAWQEARARNDFAAFAPNLERLLELSRRKADCFGWDGSPWDALAQDFERGTSAAHVAALFGPLREALARLVRRIADAPQLDTAFLDRKWDLGAQRELCRRLAGDLGFDFAAGRLDVSSHPFTINMATTDVRITTRYNERKLLESIGSTLHETGHALYEMGFRPEDDRTPLAAAPSLGLHESQSRFWEIHVGGSLEFWKRYMPVVRNYFPGALDNVAPERMARAIHRVAPGLVRTEADEVTYNLHIVIRFELEVELLEGRLPVAELPAEWNRRYREVLGVEVPNDALGCLQDVHWSSGAFGYFPSYTFGNLYAAMLLDRMETELPDLWSAVERGDFAVPLAWLRDRVHRPGRRHLPADLIERACGIPPTPEPLLRRLETKYAEIYNL